MNLEQWDEALSRFLEFQDVKEAVRKGENKFGI